MLRKTYFLSKKLSVCDTTLVCMKWCSDHNVIPPISIDITDTDGMPKICSHLVPCKIIQLVHVLAIQENNLKRVTFKKIFSWPKAQLNRYLCPVSYTHLTLPTKRIV